MPFYENCLKCNRRLKSPVSRKRGFCQEHEGAVSFSPAGMSIYFSGTPHSGIDAIARRFAERLKIRVVDIGLMSFYKLFDGIQYKPGSKNPDWNAVVAAIVKMRGEGEVQWKDTPFVSIGGPLDLRALMASMEQQIVPKDWDDKGLIAMEKKATIQIFNDRLAFTESGESYKCREAIRTLLPKGALSITNLSIPKCFRDIEEKIRSEMK
jgi:hypothetical protein